MKKNVTMKEWMLMHSYEQPNDIDHYYLKLANRIQDVLSSPAGKTVFPDENHSVLTAARLAAYFEDVISETGVWQGFTRECKKRYGWYVPFIQTTEEYYPDEINVEDIQYQLWHYCQCAKLGSMVIDPWSEAIIGLAENIYSILDEEFEKAPANPRLQELFTRGYGENDFYEFRGLVQWFHYNCYFNAENAQELNIIMQNIAQNSNDQAQFQIFAFSETVNRAFLAGCSPLALTTPEWLRRIVKEGDLKKILEDMEALEYASYKILSIEDETVTVQRMTGDLGILKIYKHSIQEGNLPENFIPGNFLHTTMVKYCGKYWLNGAMGVSDSLNTPDSQQEEFEAEPMTHEKYLEITGGKEFLFFKSARECNKFLRENVKGISLRFLQNVALCQTAMVMCYSDIAELICLGDAECLSSEDNPFYQKSEYNAPKTFKFFLPNACPYDVSQKMYQNGLLKDARFPDFKGDDKMLDEYNQYMIDYFHSNYKD